ncbi:MAG: hypothetical protein JWP25_6607 [Bradyrhizobium sp.]|nr:hypothetical protein [Bradyrhizobium sp.]
MRWNGLTGALILIVLALACIVATIMWPPRCSTTPDARIAHSIMIAGCDRR